MSTAQYYSVTIPSLGELVKVHFTTKNIDYFDANLVDYGLVGIMNFQDASKSRRPKWNILVPLNRPMVAKVEDIDARTKIIQLSIAYLDDGNREHTPDKIQETLLIHFNENHALEGLIKSLCITKEYDFNQVWTTLIHRIDELRREYNDDEEENVSLWKYFIDNIESLEEWIDDSELSEIHPDIYETLKAFYEKKNEKKNIKLSSKIGIISTGGIVPLKNMLDDILKDIHYKFELRYDSTPNYYFESFTEDSSSDDHNTFIQTLGTKAKCIKTPIFIKTEYIAKELI